MKKWLLTLMLIVVSLAQTLSAKTVEIEVHGLTCAFCVDALERKFAEMKSISKIQVSLKTKIVRLETEENEPTIDAIKQAILDSGFTPIKVTVLPDETTSE